MVLSLEDLVQNDNPVIIIKIIIILVLPCVVTNVDNKERTKTTTKRDI